MRQDPFWGPNEIRTPCLVGSQSDDDGSCIGQGDARRYRRPATQRRPLETEESEQAEDSTEEAFNARTFAEFLGSPGRGQAGAIALPLGIPGHHGHCSQHGMNPGDQAQPPISRIQADDTGA